MLMLKCHNCKRDVDFHNFNIHKILRMALSVFNFNINKVLHFVNVKVTKNIVFAKGFFFSVFNT
jgi:hypothetical protein